MESFNWRCPFCGRDTTINQDRHIIEVSDLVIKNAEGPRRALVQYIVCPNEKCRRFTLQVSLYERELNAVNRPTAGKLLHHWQLIPSSKAVAFPHYIPKPVLDDYNEACLICNLSPKASAALSRRCIQGILRDFWNVKPGNLINEIEQIEDKTDPLTWQAIDAVRKVGNIGAHMEKDINVIVDVDPNEAELLVGLIEILIRDWYIAREERKNRLNQITEIAQAKEQAKQAKKKS